LSIAKDKSAVRLSLTKMGSTSWIEIEYGITDDVDYFTELFDALHGNKPSLNNSNDYDGL
jgi:hypothetical protein